jgi:HAD superfamily hydrolase (TIGR01509 family)
VSLDAVLFDWGHTLIDVVWDDELLGAGHRAGLEAIDRDSLPDVDRLSKHFREHYEPLLWVPATIEEVEYPGLVRRLLADFDVEVTQDELNRFLEAEHAAWEPARRMGAQTHALLDSLRTRGLKTGLVSNAFDPGWLMRRDLDEMGILERIDVAVFSSEVGKRKPHPVIFETALRELGADPAQTVFVGDSRYADVLGAKRLGMTTVQALWFRADDDERGAEPDHEAFTPVDVLNIVRRLLGET